MSAPPAPFRTTAAPAAGAIAGLAAAAAAVTAAPVRFRCERQRATLSTTACARMWRTAQERAAPPQPWESLAHCYGCPIGARHAGRPDLVPFAPATALRLICPRCTRQAARLIHGRLCISCYNRELEARKGRNAKGSRPRLCAVLHAAELAVIEGDGGGAGTVRHVRQAPVVSLAEAMLTIARAAKAPLAFGRAVADATAA